MAEKQELPAAEGLLELALNSIGDAVMVFDPGCLATFLNPAAVELTGWSSEEAAGLPLEQLYPICDPCTRQPIEGSVARALREGAIVRPAGHHLLRHRKGTEHPIESVVVPIRDRHDHLAGALLVFRDVTDRLRHAQLSRELREAEERKHEFLATLAHELRNPLAPIRNALQLIHLAGADLDVIARARTIMERQVQHLVRLIDDLLDLSRLSRGRIELRRAQTDLVPIIQSALESSRPFIDAAGHQLTVDLPGEPVFLWADSARLAQVVANLLDNAAKYTEPGGRIWLTASLQRGTQGAGQVVVTVKDTGIGIEPSMLGRIFEMFAQGNHAVDRAQGGLGIGLTLVRMLVAMHGGTVEARSAGPNQGSEFIVRLPVGGAVSEVLDAEHPCA